MILQLCLSGSESDLKFRTARPQLQDANLSELADRAELYSVKHKAGQLEVLSKQDHRKATKHCIQPCRRVTEYNNLMHCCKEKKPAQLRLFVQIPAL